jgi:hypothetical protein
LLRDKLPRFAVLFHLYPRTFSSSSSPSH